MKHFTIKTIIGIALCFFLFAAVNGVWAEEKEATEANVEKIMVNGKPIDKAAYNREMKKLEIRSERSGNKLSDEDRKKYEADVVDRLITLELLYQESEKKGIKIDSKKVDEQYNMFIKRYPDEKKFKEFLDRWDVTEENIKFEIKRTTAIQELIKTDVTDKVTVADKDVKKYYEDNPDKFKAPEEIKASHILIKVDPKKADDAKKNEAKKKLEGIKKRLSEGEDFAKVAKEVSEGPSNKTGGDLGYITRGKMVKPFEDAAFALNKGEVSDIVETQFGYHLIKVFEKKPEKTLEFKEVKDNLTNQLKQQKAQKEIMAYIEKLKGSAKIENKM
ncbi:MAG: peptidylprolyl isomerase [Desulfobacteraceae bacterium]|jgi:peptidyl-prolyl cis-trans isomerase C